jgi:hypothetical protein
LDYRRSIPLRDSPKWGDFAIRKYRAGTAKSIRLVCGMIYAAIRNASATEIELTRHS